MLSIVLVPVLEGLRSRVADWKTMMPSAMNSLLRLTVWERGRR